ncbi:hypothetical protein C8F01DRAFT_1080215 [Mycena amicta]|nr:hypothetical protein C8F01DRAFT_1080215 [Mycena amicta]
MGPDPVPVDARKTRNMPDEDQDMPDAPIRTQHFPTPRDPVDPARKPETSKNRDKENTGRAPARTSAISSTTNEEQTHPEHAASHYPGLVPESAAVEHNASIAHESGGITDLGSHLDHEPPTPQDASRTCSSDHENGAYSDPRQTPHDDTIDPQEFPAYERVQTGTTPQHMARNESPLIRRLESARSIVDAAMVGPSKTTDSYGARVESDMRQEGVEEPRRMFQTLVTEVIGLVVTAARLARVILNVATLIACGGNVTADSNLNNNHNESHTPREDVVGSEYRSLLKPPSIIDNIVESTPETEPRRDSEWRETLTSPEFSQVSRTPPLSWEPGIFQRSSTEQACTTQGCSGLSARHEEPGTASLRDDGLPAPSSNTKEQMGYIYVRRTNASATFNRYSPRYLITPTVSPRWLLTSSSPSGRIALSMSEPTIPPTVDPPRIIAPLPRRPRTQRAGGLLGRQHPPMEPTRDDLQAAAALTELRRPSTHVVSNSTTEFREIAYQRLQSPFGLRPFDPRTTVLGHYGLHIARPDVFPFSRVGDVGDSRPIPAVFDPRSPMEVEPPQERVPTPRPSAEDTLHREDPEDVAVHVLHYRLGRLCLVPIPVPTSPTTLLTPSKPHVGPSHSVDLSSPTQPVFNLDQLSTPEDPTVPVSESAPDTRIFDAQLHQHKKFRREPPMLVPPNMLPALFPELQRFVEVESPNPFRAQFLQQTVRAWEKSLLHLAFLQFVLQSFAAIIGMVAELLADARRRGDGEESHGWELMYEGARNGLAYVNERKQEEEHVEELTRAQYQHQWQALHRESGGEAARILLQAFPDADYHARPFSTAPSVLTIATSEESSTPADPVASPRVEPATTLPVLVYGPGAPTIPVDPRFAKTDVLSSSTPNVESEGGEWIEAEAVGEDDDGEWMSCGSMPSLESVTGSSDSESDSSTSSISNCPPLLPISSYPPRFAMVHPTASALPVLPPVHGATATNDKVPAYNETYDHHERFQGWLAEIRRQQANGNYREAQAVGENAVNFLLQRAANPYPSLQDVNEDPFPRYMDGVPTLLSLVTLDGNASSDSPPPRSPDYFESWDFIWYVRSTNCPRQAKTCRSDTPEAMSDNGSTSDADDDKDDLVEPLENIIHSLFFDDEPSTPPHAPIRRSSGSISPPIFRPTRGLPGERMEGQLPARVNSPYVGLVFIPPSPALSLLSPASTLLWERNDLRFEKYHPGFRNYHPWWSTTHTPYLTMDKYEAAGALEIAPYDGDTLPPPPLDTPPVSPSSEDGPDDDIDESDGGQGKAEHLQELRSTIIAREGPQGLITRLDQALAPHLRNHRIERAQLFGALFQLRDIAYGKTNLGPLYDAAQCRLPDGQKTVFHFDPNASDLVIEGEVPEAERQDFRTFQFFRLVPSDERSGGPHFDLSTKVRDFRQVFGAVIERLFALAARAGIDLRECYYQFLEHHRCDYRACWFYHHPILTPVEHAQGEIAYMALHRLGYYLQADVLSRCLRVRYLPEAERIMARMQNDDFSDQQCWTNEILGLPRDDLFKYLDEDALYSQAEADARGHGIELGSGGSLSGETQDKMSIDVSTDSHNETASSPTKALAAHDESTSMANEGSFQPDNAGLDRPPDLAERLPDLANLPNERTLRVFARKLAPDIYLTIGHRAGIIPESELPAGFQPVPVDHCDLLLTLLWDDPEDFKNDLWAIRQARDMA